MKRAAGTSFWELPATDSMKELLSRVRELELISKRNCHNFLHGNYLTEVRGRGLDFHEARKYVYGESIRQIDWNITARMTEPYVRVYNEERQREIFIVLDVSPSMHIGRQNKRKIEYAVEVAASLAYSAVLSGDKLGFITYSDRVKIFSPPREGRVQLFNTLKAFYRSAVNSPDPCNESDMRQAIHSIRRLKGKRFMVFFLSDLIDYDIPDDLNYLRARHDVYLYHMIDPFEYESLGDISFISSSPEGKYRPFFISPGETGSLSKMCSEILICADKYNIKYKPISTSVPVEKTLAELFYLLKKRSR